MMAAYRIGQRVKRVAGGGDVPIGTQGTINGRKSADGFWPVLYDEQPTVGSGPDGAWFSLPENIAPLLPPDEKADAFIERLKKLGTEPVNDAPKVTVREGK